MRLWMVDWAMPDIFWDLQKARISFWVMAISVYFP